MNRDLILSPVQPEDPRLSLDDRALVAASRNAFPIVAGRSQRRDRAGLLAGGAVALLLGGITFLTMSGGRDAEPHHAAVRLSPVAVPAPVEPVAVPSPLAAAPADMPLAAPAAAPQLAQAPAPVMVFDASVPASSAPSTPHATPSVGPAKTRGGPELNENDAFAARLADGGVETASATRLVDPANTITQGTLIAAILETAIDSDLPGYVRAVVSQDVRSFDGSRVLIPRSSRLIGQYKSGLAAGQTRA
jgi:type IV secretion system protein VirB10